MLIGSDVWAPCQIHQLVTAVDSIIREDRMYDYSLWDSSSGWRVFDFIVKYQDPTSFERTFYGILTSMRCLRVRGMLQATDPRDFVYSIWGLCDDSDRVRIMPDYGLGTTMVYANAARRILALEGALDLLLISDGMNRASRGQDDVKEPPLPSWVPDWSRAYDGLPLHTLTSRSGFEKPSHVFRASAGKLYIPRLEQKPNELTVRGQAVGIVGTAYDATHTQLLTACFNAALHPAHYPLPFLACLTRLQRRVKGKRTAVDDRTLVQLLLSADSSYQYHSYFESYAADQKPTFAEHVDQVSQVYIRHREAAFQSNASVAPDMTGFLEKLIDSEHDFIARLQQHRSQTHDLREQGCQLCAKDEHGVLTQQCSDAIRQPLIENLFVTSKGMFGGSNHAVMPEDFICVLHGHDYPAILRHFDRDRYQYVGSCVLEKGMFGELVDWEEGNADTFVLV